MTGRPSIGVGLIMKYIRNTVSKPTVPQLRGLSRLWIALALGEEVPTLSTTLRGLFRRRRWFSADAVTAAGIAVLNRFRVTELHCCDCDHLVGCFVAQRGEDRTLTRICSECGHLRSYHTTGGEPAVVGV